ncbi:MAG: DUF1217 domain-containing protein [Rhodobacterales bacterium]|nr:DUF1217 domain-containing protein [Rhodobacterales bacterium]
MFTPMVLGSGPGGYAFLKRTMAQQQALFAKSPENAREAQSVRDKLSKVQTSDELVSDRALLKVALGAFGLDDDLKNRAFIKKILDSDLSDGGSLANRLADKRYLALAQTFDFVGNGGASLAVLKTAKDVGNDLSGIKTSNDLLADPSLLRATLKTFDLQGVMSNTYFLKSVLESDLTDANSFANRLTDPRYAELARMFDFAARGSQDDMRGFAALVESRDTVIATVDDLFDDPELLVASLKMFGLEEAASNPGRLRDILDSDLLDPGSVANQQEDRRFAALAGAFGFADRAAAVSNGQPFESKLEKLVALVSDREAPPATAKAFFADVSLMLATFSFFDLPLRDDQVGFVNRILESDTKSPTSLVNVFPDKRYDALAKALNLTEPDTNRTYPPGFTDALINNYLERQFEIQIGNSEPSMRFALAMERDLNQIVQSGASNNSGWFSVMASKPMREVFETVLRLPDSFGTLDVDRQLGEFKARSMRYFGTETLADFTQPELMDRLRQRYLVQSGSETAQVSGIGSVALALLSGG